VPNRLSLIVPLRYISVLLHYLLFCIGYCISTNSVVLLQTAVISKSKTSPNKAIASPPTVKSPE